MAMLTVRNIDESVKTVLRVRAARHGIAMEEEVRRILINATREQSAAADLADRIHARFKALGGLELPARRSPRPAPEL